MCNISRRKLITTSLFTLIADVSFTLVLKSFIRYTDHINSKLARCVNIFCNFHSSCNFFLYYFLLPCFPLNWKSLFWCHFEYVPKYLHPCNNMYVYIFLRSTQLNSRSRETFVHLLDVKDCPSIRSSFY